MDIELLSSRRCPQLRLNKLVLCARRKSQRQKEGYTDRIAKCRLSSATRFQQGEGARWAESHSFSHALLISGPGVCVAKKEGAA